MAKIPSLRLRRWRGPALGGALQRACRFLFASQDEATTTEIARTCRPEIVYRGLEPSRWMMIEHTRALRSIGAKRLRREGSQWVWGLKEPDESIAVANPVAKQNNV